MNEQIKKGFGFGITSGIITTLGLIIGFYSSTASRSIIIGAILIIAISDAMSDALGMHISEEFEGGNTVREIWEATGSTFLFKFIFAILFVVWFLILDVGVAVIVSIIWGALLVGLFSYYVARSQKISPLKVIFEHIFIMTLVIVITYFVGEFVARVFI